MKLLSIFDAGGALAVPVLLLVATIFLLDRANRASKSNSTQQVPGATLDNTGNVPITDTGWFVLAAIAALCTIGSIIWIYYDYS